MSKLSEELNCFCENIEEQRLRKARLLEKSIKQRTDLMHEKKAINYKLKL